MLPNNALISLEGIQRLYSMGDETIYALRGIDLQIKRNEYVALMGPSGSGKSTLMNLIGCLDSPSSGSYWLNGQDVAGLSDNRLAEIRNREIGFVFQTFNLLPRLTALDNVALPLVYAGVTELERRERAHDVLKQVGLQDRVGHRPNELSGGQRQRVALARALVNKPSLILADEPTGNLDSKTSVEIMEMFASIHALGNTIVLVTHEEDIARHAHRMVRLKDGRIESDALTLNQDHEDLHQNG
ncbi:MAG: ABC transporter ATP-binding protein [Sphingobacteriia bacterium]|jgi:putative ABC transport system ATP-binding protein|nr:ABC transporter ATP-binding protein [Sphingobacteriia bacterium]NDC71943.1 ABC transporter ATP-binding protein [Sphingobacteriia bacterium]